jgi:hypothetical protein
VVVLGECSNDGSIAILKKYLQFHAVQTPFEQQHKAVWWFEEYDY